MQAGRTEDSRQALNTTIESFLEILPSLRDGVVLDKHKAFIYASILLASPHLQRYFLKFMHFELKNEDVITPEALRQPQQMIQLLLYALSLANERRVPGTFIIDQFAAQYDSKKGFDYLTQLIGADPLNSSTNRVSRDVLHAHAPDVEYVDFGVKKLDLPAALKALKELNLHGVADAIPRLPINVIRRHDHRKVMIFDFPDEYSILLLPSFNIENPLDYDSTLVVLNPEIISVFRRLLAETNPTSSVTPGEGWTVYQDGTYDLDPTKPVESSPILSRIQTILDDPTTNSLTWSSQVLPDVDDLMKMEKRIKEGTMKDVTIYAPHPQLWFGIYKVLEGNRSHRIATRIAANYPGQFRVIYSMDRIHAKFIVVNADTLLIGSHNFNRSLVQSKVSEWALEYKSMGLDTKDSLKRFLASIDKSGRRIDIES